MASRGVADGGRLAVDGDAALIGRVGAEHQCAPSRCGRSRAGRRRRPPRPCGWSRSKGWTLPLAAIALEIEQHLGARLRCGSTSVAPEKAMSLPSIRRTTSVRLSASSWRVPTSLPLRSTVMRSEMAKTWSRKWVMKTMPRPLRLEAARPPRTGVSTSLRVEAGGRLVEDQHLARELDGAGDGDDLLHGDRVGCPARSHGSMSRP